VRLLLIGGTRFVGRHAVVEAVGRGHEVTVFHRGNSEPTDAGFPDVEHRHGDRDGRLDVLEGSTWDAVLDTCGFVPRVVRRGLDALAGSAGSYAFVSSLSAYPEDVGPGATEETPAVPPDDDGEEVTDTSYGPMKVACERAVAAVFPGRATILRPGFIAGPSDTQDRFASWLRRADQGGPILAPEPADLPVQLVDARDLASFAIDLIERGADGIWNVTGPGRTLTMRELLETCVRVAGSGATLTWVDGDWLRERGLHEPGDHGWEQLPYWYPELPGFSAFNVSKAVADGLRFRPLEETVADTLAWDRARDRSVPLNAGIERSRELELLAEWDARSA
jgi:2'-hydroxyisoflavone reductase